MGVFLFLYLLMIEFFAAIGLILSGGIPFFLLFNRKKNWASSKNKKVLGFSFFCVGMGMFLFANSNGLRYFSYAFVVTSIYLVLDFWVKKWSFKIHNRDIYLWLRGSDEDNLDGVKLSDKLFSFILLLLIMSLIVLGALLFGKGNWYGKFLDRLNTIF